MAIPQMDGRVSPVFDVTARILVVDVEDRREVKRQEIILREANLSARAEEMAALGCDALICCAISWPLEAALISKGINVIARTCGPVEAILEAYVKGRLTDQSFLMPGCRGRRKRFRGGDWSSDPGPARGGTPGNLSGGGRFR